MQHLCAVAVFSLSASFLKPKPITNNLPPPAVSITAVRNKHKVELSRQFNQQQQKQLSLSMKKRVHFGPAAQIEFLSHWCCCFPISQLFPLLFSPVNPRLAAIVSWPELLWIVVTLFFIFWKMKQIRRSDLWKRQSPKKKYCWSKKHTQRERERQREPVKKRQRKTEKTEKKGHRGKWNENFNDSGTLIGKRTRTVQSLAR